jgi:hypothetical protein
MELRFNAVKKLEIEKTMVALGATQPRQALRNAKLDYYILNSFSSRKNKK